MDMSNIGRKGKAKLTRLDVGPQTERPDVSIPCLFSWQQRLLQHDCSAHEQMPACLA